MKTQRYEGPPPWTVRRATDEPAFVVGEEGENILKITSSEVVAIPRFIPVLPEQQYVDTLAETVKDMLGRPPQAVHVFEHQDLLGMCAL